MHRIDKNKSEKEELSLSNDSLLYKILVTIMDYKIEIIELDFSISDIALKDLYAIKNLLSNKFTKINNINLSLIRVHNDILLGLNSYNSIITDESIQINNDDDNNDHISLNLLEHLFFLSDKISNNQCLNNTFPKLSYLNLSSNNLNYLFFENISFLPPNITHLNLASNYLTHLSLNHLFKLIEKSNRKLENINLINNKVGDKGCIYISKIITILKNLKYLDLMRNNIYSDGLIYLSQGIKNNKSLETLLLDDNFISEKKAIRELLDALIYSENTKFNTLGLSSNRLNSESLLELTKIYSAFKMKSIDLYDNNLNDSSILVFFNNNNVLLNSKHVNKIDISLNNLTAEFSVSKNTILANNTILSTSISKLLLTNPIKTIDLSNTSFGDSGIEELSKGLKKCCFLTNLILSKTEISDIGISLLSESLKYINTINKIDLQENKISHVGLESFCIKVFRKYSLKIVNLCRNKRIMSQGCKIIGSHLKNCLGIENLNLNSCEIENEGLFYLSKGLKENDTLRILSISNNLINNVIKNEKENHINEFIEAVKDKDMELIYISCNSLVNSSLIKELLKYCREVSFTYNSFDNQCAAEILDGYGSNHPISEYLNYNNNVSLSKTENDNKQKNSKFELIEEYCQFEKRNYSHFKNFNCSSKKIGEDYTAVSFASAVNRYCSWDEALKQLTKLNSLNEDNKEKAVSMNKYHYRELVKIDNFKLEEAYFHYNALINITLSYCEISSIFCDDFFYTLNADVKIKELNLNSNKIGDQGCKSISTFLSNCVYLEYLKLSSNNIQDKGFDFIGKALASNSSLKEIIISNNDVSFQGLSDFFERIKNNSSLRILNISAVIKKKTSLILEQDSPIILLINNKLQKKNHKRQLDIDDHINNSPPAIPVYKLSEKQKFVSINKFNQLINEYYNREIEDYDDEGFWDPNTKSLMIIEQDKYSKLNSNSSSSFYSKLESYCYSESSLLKNFLFFNTSLLELNLNNNNITDISAWIILQSLVMNKSLIKLFLGSNNLTDACLINFQQVLKTNTTLKVLELNTNKISDNGFNEIYEGLYTNNTIESINLSNNKLSEESCYKLIDIIEEGCCVSLKNICFMLNLISKVTQHEIIKVCNTIKFNLN